MERDDVQDWLDRYVEAWRHADHAQIRALFTADAVYYDAPYKEPWRGHEAIVKYWDETGDPPDAFDAHYEPLEVRDSFAAAHGWSRYFTEDRSQVEKEYLNVFLLWFDDAGRCREYREWYMARPKPAG